MEIPEFYCLSIRGFSLPQEGLESLTDVAIEMMTNNRKIVTINNHDQTIFCIVKQIDNQAQYLGMSGSIFEVNFEKSKGWSLRYFIRNTNRHFAVVPKPDRRQAEVWFFGPERRVPSFLEGTSTY